MSPTRDRATSSSLSATGALAAAVVVGVAALGAAACGKQAFDPSSGAALASAAAPPVATEVVVGDPVTAPAPTALVAAVPTADAASPDEGAEPESLPRTWTGPIVPGLTFADALRKGRGAREALARLVVPSPSAAKEPTVKAWYGQAQSLADQASRMYAAAFHAPDAAREGRIDAIAEAAELDMTMARDLDDAGLGSLPVAWRSDPAVPSTFEDIAVGPTRRWRDEARVLARQCVETARESGVLTDAARRCALLRTGAPLKAARSTSRTDAGTACACAEGDPLCSASLGGWCGARP